MVKNKAIGKRSRTALMACALLIVAVCLYALVVHPASAGTNNTYSYQNESQRASQDGYTLSSSAFSCSSALQCVKVLIAQCDNNNPSQFICINSAHLGEFSNMTKNNGSVACPQYMLAGTISCSCTFNYCTESYTK
jgi:hypothetical protein